MSEKQHTSTKRRKLLKATALAGTTGLAGCTNALSSGGGEDQSTSQGSNYPVDPVTFVIWASRGGGSDTITRQGYIRPIEKNDMFPVPVKATNKVGGGGEVGMRYTLNQPPNGYTVLNVSTNLIVTPLSRDIGITYKDFTPVARMGIEPEVLVIRSDDDRFNSIEEFKQYAQENRVKIGTFSVGTQDHTTTFLLKERSNMDIEIVPYSGGGKQISALLGGEIDASILQPSEMAAQHEAGKVEYILQFSEEKLSQFPELPYVSQVFDFSIKIEQLRGTVMHGETPPERVEWMREKFRAIYETDEFKQYAENNNVSPSLLVGEEFGDYLDKVNQQIESVFKKNNLGIYK